MATQQTTATLETQYGKVTVAVNSVDLTITDLMETVIFPLLLGAGYSQEVIDGYWME